MFDFESDPPTPHSYCHRGARTANDNLDEEIVRRRSIASAVYTKLALCPNRSGVGE